MKPLGEALQELDDLGTTGILALPRGGGRTSAPSAAFGASPFGDQSFILDWADPDRATALRALRTRPGATGGRRERLSSAPQAACGGARDLVSLPDRERVIGPSTPAPGTPCDSGTARERGLAAGARGRSRVVRGLGASGRDAAPLLVSRVCDNAAASLIGLAQRLGGGRVCHVDAE